MALTKGVNSYVTVAEADAHFEDRLDVAAWTAADPTQKAQALVTATAILDDLLWGGIAVSELQILAFPRIGMYFDPRVGMSVSFPDGYPLRLTKATFEEAYHLLNNDGLLDNTGGVVNMSVGSISLSSMTSANLIPGVVRRLISPMLVNRGAHSWFRAN